VCECCVIGGIGIAPFRKQTRKSDRFGHVIAQLYYKHNLQPQQMDIGTMDTGHWPLDTSNMDKINAKPNRTNVICGTNNDNEIMGRWANGK